MKAIQLYLCLIISSIVSAQSTDYNRMFRYYNDNDFINITGHGTDRAYTGGASLDLYYTKTHPSKFFIDKWFPKAGKEAINTFNFSLNQIAYTPNNIKTTEPDVDDYPYSGALYLVHGLHSSNAVKQYALRAEIAAGIMGPYSYADDYQKLIHKAIDYQSPMGWNYQMPTDILLNLNLGFETMIYQPTNWLEIIGGANAMVGTMKDGASINTTIRIGKMRPYFDGLINQFATSKSSGKSRLQLYAFAKPTIEWTGYYAPLDGGIIKGRSNYYATANHNKLPYKTNKNINPAFDAGLVASFGKFAFSFTQKILAPQLLGYKAQTTGNISFYLGF